MTFDTIIDILLVEFPALLGPYKEDEWHIGGLPHLVFAFIFVPYLLDLAKRDNVDADLTKSLQFVERMLLCPDGRVRELAGVSVLEDLELHHDALRKLYPYFGPETLSWFRECGPDSPISPEEQ